MQSLPLTKGFCALVDDEDFEALSRWKWTAVITGQRLSRVYAYRRTWPERQALYLHRAIMNAPAGMDVDHVNGDTLDNRRHNLRLATRSQNLANSRRARGVTGFRGVTLEADCASAYCAQIKSRKIGWFRTAEEAARAYDAAALEEFGEFAKLNFPEELGRIG